MKTQQRNSSIKFRFNKKFVASLMVWLLFGSFICLAQRGTQQRGTYPQGSYALSDIETINPVNGNLMFNLPLGALPAGRKGMGAGVGLHYNSKLYDSYIGTACGWDSGTNEYVCAEVEQLYASPEGGWRYGKDATVRA